jgi:hypothetical protein
VTLLTLCSAQYATTLTHDLQLHFLASSGLLLAALGITLVALNAERVRTWWLAHRRPKQPNTATPAYVRSLCVRGQALTEPVWSEI